MHRTVLVVLLLVFSVAGHAAADEADGLTYRIDAHLPRDWIAAGIQSVEPCDDATFLRRVFLMDEQRSKSVGPLRSKA